MPDRLTPEDVRILNPPMASAPAEQTPESDPTLELIEAQRPSVLVWVGVVGGFVLLGMIAIGFAQKPSPLVVPLVYQPSCGSSSSSSGDWWPVLGPANDHLLDLVRSRYCGDAYINANGYLQVASFNSPSEAEQFVQRLSVATGASFRIGEPYNP